MRPARLARLLIAALTAALTLTGTAFAGVTGPDVSSWQHPSGSAINWPAVKAAGQDFTFIKATEGTNYTNAYFAGDWAASAAAGLYRGAYHYARPGSSSAATQARYFAAAIGDQRAPMTLPPTLDLEESGGLSPAALISWTKTFLTTVESLTGRRPILYTYPYFWRNAMAGSTAFTQYPLWIASYGTSAPPSLGWPSWTFWQYSSTSTVRGISGNGTDMSTFNGSMSDLAALANSTAPAGGGTPSGITDPVSPAAIALSQPSRYVPITPARFVDTRTGLGARQGAVSGPLTVTLPDSVPVDATGVVLNASVVDPSAAGYLRVAPAGATPLATALNFPAGQSSTGLVVTPVSAARQATVNVYGGPGQVVLDAVGYYTSTAGAGGYWVPLTPSRIVDTRQGLGGVSGPQKDANLTFTLPAGVPADSPGVVLNVSVVDPAHAGFLRIAPTGTTPTTTALSFPVRDSATSLVLTKTNGRQVTVTVRGGPTQVVVDLIGYYDAASSTGQAFQTSTPQRILDTRSGLGASGRRVQSVTLTLPASVPAGATGAVLNLSAVSPSGKGYVRLAAAGETPTTTAISFAGGKSVTGLALAPIGAGRQVTVTVYGAAVDVVADLVGVHTSGG